MWSLLKRGLIVNDILRLNIVLVTHTQFPDKLHSLIILISQPMTKYRIRITIKDVSYIVKALVIIVCHSQGNYNQPRIQNIDMQHSPPDKY